MGVWEHQVEVGWVQAIRLMASAGEDGSGSQIMTAGPDGWDLVKQ